MNCVTSCRFSVISWNVYQSHIVVYLLCLGSEAVCSNVNNNSDKESALLLLLSETSDGRNGADAAHQVFSAGSSQGGELVTYAISVSDASRDSSIQSGEDCGLPQVRAAREPVDKARYIMVDGRNGTLFACSRCSKQYFHRKSLNKHWNDKHADNATDRHKYSIASTVGSQSESQKRMYHLPLVHCSSISQHIATSCTPSLDVHSYTRSSPTRVVVPVAYSRQKTHECETNFTGTIRDSLLWHSLSAIHLNHQPELNSFHSAPLSAHSSYFSVAGSFLNHNFHDDDDCQVLDLSKNSCSLFERSYSPICDVPVDLSVKSKDVVLSNTEKAALSFDENINLVTELSVSYCQKIPVVDTAVLNKAQKCVVRDDNSKSRKHLESDSVALLRQLHSGTSTKRFVPSKSNSQVADAVKYGCSEVGPSVKCECLPNHTHFENNLKVNAKPSLDLATSDETHQFFGGMSRGGHIRCKACDFSATSLLLFSRHVARHVKKPIITSGPSNAIQNECIDGAEKVGRGFFTCLGLKSSHGADVETNKSARGPNFEGSDMDKNSHSKCTEVTSDVAKLPILSVEANAVASHENGECEVQGNGGSGKVGQKRVSYRRGLGLTTTESTDAAGRSWRRRRLRTCERCGYVTDNVTTLKRHELKHGALGMYRCKLCDYTVNQQHILEYHMRNVHRLLRPQLPQLIHCDVPRSDEPCHKEIAADVLVGDVDASCKGQLEMVSTKQEGYGDDDDVHCTQSAASSCGRHKFVGSTVQCPTSVTAARRHLLDTFGLRVGRGICVRCGFRSLSVTRMTLHMLQHPHERHACVLCSHTSQTAKLLTKHLKQHPDSVAHKKTYHCQECPFTASSSSQLQCHTQFHGVQPRHACGTCSYSADCANLMAEHRRLHAPSSTCAQKRRWIHCGRCPFKTLSKASLGNHERGHCASSCRYVCSLCAFGSDVANVALHHERLHS